MKIPIRMIMIMLTALSYAVVGFSQPKSLQECIELAQAQNPDVLKSGYSLQQSALSTKQAWSSLYPSLSASASTANSGPFFSDARAVWDQNIGASVNQQFYRAGMYSGISLARARQTSSEYSDVSLQNQIRTSVERLYFQILASDTLIGVYEANIRLSDEQIRKMKLMVELGSKRQSDLLKSQVQRGTFESQLIREMETLASSKRSLNILMGQQPNAILEVQLIDVGHIVLPDYQTADWQLIFGF